MHFEGKYKWTDYLHANRLVMRDSRASRILHVAAYAAGCLMFLWGIWQWGIGQFPYSILLPLLLLLAAIDLYFLLFLPRQARRIFEQRKELSLPWGFEVTEAGLRFHNELGNSLIPWKNIIKWKEDSDMLLLFQSDVSFHMLPRRFMTEPGLYQGIKDQLERNGVPPAKDRFSGARMIIFLLVLVILMLVVISTDLWLRLVP